MSDDSFRQSVEKSFRPPSVLGTDIFFQPLFFSYDPCGCITGLSPHLLPSTSPDRRQILTSLMSTLGNLLLSEIVKEKRSSGAKLLYHADKVWFDKVHEELGDTPVSEWGKMKIQWDLNFQGVQKRPKGPAPLSRITSPFQPPTETDGVEYEWWTKFCQDLELTPKRVAENELFTSSWEALLDRKRRQLVTTSSSNLSLQIKAKGRSGSNTAVSIKVIKPLLTNPLQVPPGSACSNSTSPLTARRAR